MFAVGNSMLLGYNLFFITIILCGFEAFRVYWTSASMRARGCRFAFLGHFFLFRR